MSIVTLREAADLLGVDVQAVRMWKRRGLITPKFIGERGTLYYDMGEVYRAESITRRRDTRRRRARKIAREAEGDP